MSASQFGMAAAPMEMGAHGVPDIRTLEPRWNVDSVEDRQAIDGAQELRDCDGTIGV